MPSGSRYSGSAASGSGNPTGSTSGSSTDTGYAPPRRSPTDSSYSANSGRDPSTTWMYAADARAQQANAPTQQFLGVRYAGYYGNKDANGNPCFPLSIPPESIPNPRRPGHSSTGWLHHPLIPGEQATYVSGTGRPGAVRSVYPPSDRANFDVMYHDSGRGGDFSKATYVPKR
ncbi:unnamed protein product [Clonostachys chloroleuca]|uniref:Uncharacterized protein n=1 Tax=Clonostachys chloroleuca TaxID=1926264 RepID=A0AA35LVU5_9HYPO|nr:unnamed protein product [Clonostachys chloroleuca]